MRRIELSLSEDTINEIVIDEMKDVYDTATSNLVRMGALAILDYYMLPLDFSKWSKDNE